MEGRDNSWERRISKQKRELAEWTKNMQEMRQETRELLRVLGGRVWTQEKGLEGSPGSVDEDQHSDNENQRRTDYAKRWTSKQKKGLAVSEAPAEGRELFEALKDMEDHFLRVCDSGKEVTRVLEANKIQEEWKPLEEKLPPLKPPDLNGKATSSGFPSYGNRLMKRSHQIELSVSNLEDKVVRQRVVFVFLAAEYETPKHSLNQISLWDGIIPSKEHAKFWIHTSNKYRFIDQGSNLRSKEYNLTMHWHVMPKTGKMSADKIVMSGYRLPAEYR
ncbi:hypothetical protein LR48_Vigan09g152600 [Vigna angularis]|uniref:Signal peptidase complex subunit 3 n=1 Tax=Phaseolus angularis TaxID=3914 RepID=A0A0L9VD52_PHAAN|nr:hypothetical protein LR48_Vigan09g152600 [Vigna angularis]